jgi:hypothetical protein
VAWYALGAMPDQGIDPKLLKANLARAEERVERAQAELLAAQREVVWLREGLKIHDAAEAGPDAGSANGGPESSKSVAARYVRKLLPDGVQTRRPTLRQAILIVMRAGVTSEWTVPDLAMMLRLNNWLPRGDYSKRISDMAGVMVTEGHLKRTGRGVYRVSPPLAMAMSQALPPITDYRRAAAEGLPVPDHVAAGGGLSDD